VIESDSSNIAYLFIFLSFFSLSNTIAQMDGCGGALVAAGIVLFAAHCGDCTGGQVIIGAFKADTTNKDAQVRFCDKWEPDPEYIEWTKAEYRPNGGPWQKCPL
jgi:hypothetical protein